MNRHPGLPQSATERWIDIATLRDFIADPARAVIADRRVVYLHDLTVPDIMPVQAREHLKSWTGLRRLTAFIEHRYRTGAREVVALGGGTVGDAVGLAAHLARRGMPLVQVPSTLLAAADSSIGGKVAINGPDGAKNSIGAYHFPHLTLLVPALWTTLEQVRRMEGLAEAVKMALCLDAVLARTWLITLPKDRALVRAARALKKRIVRADPFETRGLRQVLNFGHSIGHAIEMMSNHRMPHGLAVAQGMVGELDVARLAGLTPDEVAGDAEQAIARFYPAAREVFISGMKAREWDEFSGALTLDKKGYLRFVVLDTLGTARVREIEEKYLREAFRQWRQS